MMKIQCPKCRKITELEHVDHGSMVECVCAHVFPVEPANITEEFTEIDSRLPDRIGPYPVTGFIGFGGMGKVYLGRHPNLDIPVAIKVLRVEYMTDRASCDRFIQSAKICARINHPNIVRIYDCGYENNNVYLVMEYIPGGSAQTLLEQEGKLDPDHAAFIMLEVCSGLMEAEKSGIVHRDIKPENIMFDREGTVKILDLGLSKIRNDRRISSQSITASLTSLGTPLYMAPEQAVDAANCDSRADIYSIGVTLYQLCTGKPPFESDDPHELRRMHALEKPVPPRQLTPTIRTDMETIILRCLEKKREQRYASITDLALDLEAYLKNRILPSAIRQQESGSVRRRKRSRRLSRQILGFRRKTVSWLKNNSRILCRLALVGLAAAAIPVGIVCGIGIRKADMPEKSRRIRLSTDKVMSDLARLTAGYVENQDFEPVIRHYRDYRGPLEKETRRKREQIAEGYRLTRQQMASGLRMELAELILKRQYDEAWNRFQSKNGKYLCPEGGELLQALAEMPAVFRQYWKQREGQHVSLSLSGRGKTDLRIVEVKTFQVYAALGQSGQLIHFSLHELPLEEQLQILRRQPAIVRMIWTGLHLLHHGQREPALRRLKNMPGFSREITQLLMETGPRPESDRDSVRSR